MSSLFATFYFFPGQYNVHFDTCDKVIYLITNCYLILRGRLDLEMLVLQFVRRGPDLVSWEGICGDRLGSWGSLTYLLPGSYWVGSLAWMSDQVHHWIVGAHII